MYEVILTYRPDFREKVVDRFPTEAEAQALAARLSSPRHESVIRIWVRHIRQVKSNP